MVRKFALTGLLLGAVVPFSHAADMSLSVEVPRLNVAEYHRPYVAAWLQNQDNTVTNLAVWYQLDTEGKGLEWLKDMRQWWRRSGRALTMPADADAFTGATRPPGMHQVELKELVKDLPKGEYRLFVEASREVGGREMLEIPFSWPADKSETLEAQGSTELGRIELKLTR